MNMLATFLKHRLFKLKLKYKERFMPPVKLTRVSLPP